MDHPAPAKPRTIRAVRKRAAPPLMPTRKAPSSEQEPELSNYELIERRSRELEVEHANGGTGTAQPPDAETPLLFSKPSNVPNAAPHDPALARSQKRLTPNR
jgi:hypothetical protein